LIFGHGMYYSDLQKMMEKYEKVEEGDFVYQTAKGSALFSVASHRKNVEGIIGEHINWFGRLKDITDIHIFGHSLGVVDLPYFNTIFNSCDKKKVRVEISCFDDEAKEKALSLIKASSIPLSHYKPITLESLQVLKE